MSSKQKVVMVKKEEEIGQVDDHCSLSNKKKMKKGSDHDNNTNMTSTGGVGGGGGSASSMRCCQADKCSVDLTDAKQYHHRHKVCELHAKSQAVLVAGIHQRFCQQCSRFHELSEFDEAKRSCRRRLAGHNERRRKNSAEQSNMRSDDHQGSSLSSRKSSTHKEHVCGHVDERGRIQISIHDNTASYKHFQMR